MCARVCCVLCTVCCVRVCTRESRKRGCTQSLCMFDGFHLLILFKTYPPARPPTPPFQRRPSRTGNALRGFTGARLWGRLRTAGIASSTRLARARTRRPGCTHRHLSHQQCVKLKDSRNGGHPPPSISVLVLSRFSSMASYLVLC